MQTQPSSSKRPDTLTDMSPGMSQGLKSSLLVSSRKGAVGGIIKSTCMLRAMLHPGDVAVAAILLQASADKAPPLLDIAAALAASPRLAVVLADMSAVPLSAAALPLPCVEAWASVQHLGSRYGSLYSLRALWGLVGLWVPSLDLKSFYRCAAGAFGDMDFKGTWPIYSCKRGLCCALHYLGVGAIGSQLHQYWQ